MPTEGQPIPAERPPQSSGYLTALVLAVCVAALYVGRDIFVPVALAILLSFMLAPLVSWLQQRRVPQTAAVIAVVAFAIVLIAGFALAVATQLTQLGANLPGYQLNIQTKIRAVKTSELSDGLIGRVGKVLQRLSDEVTRTAEPKSDKSATPERVAPIPVKIEEGATGPLEIIKIVLVPVIKPLTTLGIVIVLVIFILLQRQDLRDRFIRLAGTGDLSRTTQALEDAGSRVAQYLLMQLVVNVTYGIPVAVGLWWIGVPNPLLWGMMATVLRFVPYIGPIIAAMLPLALAVAVDPGWTMLFWTASLFIVIELVSNNFIEPWLYGSRTGLSSFAIILAAIFWTWLWGPVGLLLSTPLTVCLVVLGRHVPLFAFLDVLLGSEPVLTAVERLSQRLLAGDPDEATEIAEAFMAEHSLAGFYETIAMPALVSIERDRARGVIDSDRRKSAAESMVALVDNLSDHQDEPLEKLVENGATPLEPAVQVAAEWQVLCLGGRGTLDDAASSILAQLLQRRGVGARATSFVGLPQESVAQSDSKGIRLICLSYLDERSTTRARYLVKRLRRRDPNIQILVGLWATPLTEPEKKEAQESVRADYLESSVLVSVDLVVGIVTQPPRPGLRLV